MIILFGVQFVLMTYSSDELTPLCNDQQNFLVTKSRYEAWRFKVIGLIFPVLFRSILFNLIQLPP